MMINDLKRFCSIMLLFYAGISFGEVISLSEFYGPKGVETRVVPNKDKNSYNLTIASTEKQQYSYSAYAVTNIQTSGKTCLLSYKVSGQASRASILNRFDKEIASFSTSGQHETVRLPFKTKIGENYRLLFYKIERISIPVVYENIQIKCIDANEIPPKEYSLLKLEDFARSALDRSINNKNKNIMVLKKKFAYIAKILREKNNDSNNSYILSFFLISEFMKIEQELKNAYPRLNEKFYWPFYAANVAHFAISLTRQDKPTPHEILIDGGGTCWQQAQVAAFLYNCVKTGDNGHVVSSDPYVLGHTFFSGDDFIVDVTNNIFLPISAANWNALKPYQRLNFLEESAIFGIDLDVFDRKGRKASLELFSQKTFEQGYIDTIVRLPFARMMIQPTLPIKSL